MRRALRDARELPAVVLLVAAALWLLLSKPSFRSPGNLAVVGQDAGMLGLMACGETLVILTGGIDLSVASALAMSACLCGALIMAGTPWPAAAIAAIGLGLLAGWVNGALVTWRRLPPILVTLATLLLFRGITNILTGAAPYNLLPEAYKAIGRGGWPMLALVVVASVLSIGIGRSRFGRHLVASGGNESAARLSGIGVPSVLRRAYALSGMLAASAGLLMAAANGNAQWTLADGWELDVIAAVVIGGVRLTGGQGSVFGATVGALIIVILRNALFLSGVPTEQYGLVTGGVIVAAALSERWRSTAADRR
ncbi:MAG: ABC transporter permease [Chthonomonadales bacterium]|nr:ABC transporter permease [Chthonomonadales bacterium]